MTGCDRCWFDSTKRDISVTTVDVTGCDRCWFDSTKRDISVTTVDVTVV